ncbi:hypothetical protein I4U23_027535 [Adineta vaga]|nr:hypothetical protein I4U23_027535 [Adineta vaga]
MLLLQIQSIKNIRTLLNAPDVLAVINIKCKELTNIKNRICFINENNNNQFVVKAGIKGALAYSSKNHTSTASSMLNSSNLNSSISAMTPTTANSTANTNSIDLTLTLSANITTLNSVPTTDVTTSSLDSTTSLLTPTNNLISTSIEKFSLSTFTNLVLRNKHDYTVSLAVLDKDIDGYIKCRSNTNTFQLSSFFKHVKNSCCVMKKKQQTKTTSKEMNASLSKFSENNDYDNNREDVDDDENAINLTNQNDSYRMETDNSVSQKSDTVRKKRSLSNSTSSRITKNQKHDNM